MPERVCRRLRLALGVSCLLAWPGIAAAQEAWNSPEALALVARATARREVDRADSGLAAYHAVASGLVLFLAQIGEGLDQPPRLVKADQLSVEVYWRAPGLSKQIIKAWRDGRWLPTDIRYHRDHLGIVTNDFGPRIRIGEGDEVRDVPHPLSPGGGAFYDFALGETLTLSTGGRTTTVRAVRVRPRDWNAPAVVGTLFLDTGTAAVVRFRFGFTPAAYLDSQLEDITVLLESALSEGRYWLPAHQEIEIRRRVPWLDFPARSIIRGRWEIGDYQLNPDLPLATFGGPSIAGLQTPDDSSTSWDQSLAAVLQSDARPLEAGDIDQLRQEVARIAGDQALDRLARTRFAFGSISDLAHVNRVQGLTLGGGATFSAGRWRLTPTVGYGFADGLVTGAVRLERRGASGELHLQAGRRITDFSDLQAASRLVNSFSAQEWGNDFADYVLLDEGWIGATRLLGSRATIGLDLGVQRAGSLGVTAAPMNGVYSPNPALGAGTFGVARLALARPISADLKRDWGVTVSWESGAGPAGYSRSSLDGRGRVPLGPGSLAASLHAGAGTDALPGYRSFALGGRYTLPGEAFRAWGGRTAVLLHLEWRLSVPGPSLPLGAFASTGRRFTLAPFVAAGWADGTVEGVPWVAGGGIRPVAGIAAEFFLNLMRLEAGVGLRTGDLEVSLDFTPAWWPIL
jgi:hypothetical protein